MPYVVISDSPATLAFHREVNRRLGSEPAPGLLATFAGETEQGLRVVSIWESKVDSDRFVTEDLMPIVRQLVPADRLGPHDAMELEVVDAYVVADRLAALAS